MRKTLGFFAGPLIALAIAFIPLPGLSPEAHRLASVLALVVTFWLTEAIPIPVTALLGAALCVVLGVAPPAKIWASFGDPILFLFIGSFMLAKAMEIHGLDRRLAYSFLAHRWIGARSSRILWGMALCSWLISMWVSNTATVAMLFPVALAIARTGEELAMPRFNTALLLLLAYAASVGGIATPVGTPPNLIGIALIEQVEKAQIGFFQWMAFGLPIALILLVVSYLVVHLLLPPEKTRIPGQPERMRKALEGLGPWSRGERNSLFAFLVAVSLWVGPGILSLWMGSGHPLILRLSDRVPEAVAAILAAGLLFFLPVDWKRREFTLHWEEAVQIDWGTVLLFGGGIALGRLVFDTGLASALGQTLLDTSGLRGPGSLIGAAALTSTLISETASNTASANMMVPVMISVAKAAGLSGTVMGIAATLGASLGFMLPVSTPPNAMVYGSGKIRLADMVKTGLLLDLIGILVVWLFCLLWVPRVFS